MSYKNSNLYASRVFSEHPLAMWTLDDDNYFISLLSDNEKNIDSGLWSVTNATIGIPNGGPLGLPIETSGLSKVWLESISPRNLELSLTSPIEYYAEIDKEKGSICFSSFIYIPRNTFIDKIHIGLIVDGQKHYSKKSGLITDSWHKISFTNDIQVGYEITPYIEVFYADGNEYGETNSSIYFNGISLGQWSEQFNSISTGNFLKTLPTEIENLLNLSTSDNVECFEIDPYGLNNDDIAYATVLNKTLLAQPGGIPMVYGSKNTVSVIHNESEIPSLIFPGKGFLNKSGKNATFTTEFWLRISNEEINDFKIFGSINSKDGIYVNKEFITLRVDGYIKSYFVGKWYRPMLIHFTQSPREISLMINGEKVISIQKDISAITTFTNADEDYVGFYGSQNIPVFEIDCFSIFPYVVSEQVAKKRYVFGQGVQEQETIISGFGGELSYIDFPYAGYSSTIKYPDRTSWTDGFYNNIVANSEGISLPSYDLPEIKFKNDQSIELLSTSDIQKIYQSFEEDNYSIQDEEYPFIKMNPSAEYDNLYGSLYFPKIDTTNYQTKSIHAILKTDSDVSTKQSLMYVYSNNGIDYFETYIASGSVQYAFNDDVIYSEPVSINQYIKIGLDFDVVSKKYSSILKTFFLNTGMLSLNFCGNANDKFTGKIFSITFNNKFFVEKDGLDLFNSYGFTNVSAGDSLFDYIGTYTLVPKITNTSVILDIASSGYWENSIPLSYFGKYVLDANGDKKYDLGLIQFNIDIPSSMFSKENPTSLSFQESLISKAYITIQNNRDSLTMPYTHYENTQIIGLNRVIDFNNVDDIETTKFEICDGTVIFPLKDNLGFSNYSITLHIILSSKGTKTENIRIKDMSLSSISSNEADFYPISTPSSGKFYPIAKIQDQYVYERNIPVLIDTESSPYLYLTGNSGISIVPQADGDILKGVSIPVNSSLKADQEIVGIQMFLMYDENRVFSERRLLGKFFTTSDSYDIVLIPETDSKRAFIKVYDSVKRSEIPGAKYFLNGNLVDSLVINPMVWNFIVISLQESSLVLDKIIGEIELYSGFKIDNVSSFTDVNSIKTQLINYDGWDEADNFSWNHWISSSWSTILDERQLQVTLLSVDGSDVFNNYTGLSSFIGNDNSQLSVNFDSVNMLNDARWNTFEIKPT